jgi:hypothetical protein
MTKMNIAKTAFLTISALLLTACSSTNSGAERGNISGASEVPRLSQLSTDRLPVGQCGMLLWTMNAGQPVLVFRTIAGGQAEAMLDGKKQKFLPLAQKGDIRFGIGSQQSYRSAASSEVQTIEIQVEYGASFGGGVYVDEGVLRLINEQGWERIIPVAGLSGCRKA